jgi:hypothetical protein
MDKPISVDGLVTQAAYARLRRARGLPGGTGAAVCFAVQEGRISLTNGLVDPSAADAQWKRNTRERLDPQQRQEREAQLAAERRASAAAARATRHRATKERQSKRCGNCDVTKPLTAFYRNKSLVDGHAYVCKACQDSQAARRRTERAVKKNREHRDRLNEILADGQKECFQCGARKPFAEFATDSSRLLGVRATCKECEKPAVVARAQRTYQNHRDAVLQRVAAYRDENREAIRQYARLRRKTDCEAVNDRYVTKLLTRDTRALKPSQIPKAIVEAKRLEVQIRRYLKEKS